MSAAPVSCLDYLTRAWRKDYVRFLFTGVLNTAFGYGAYALFVILGVEYHLALFFSTFLGILFNFQTIGRVVFRHCKKELMGKFFITYGIIFVANQIVLTALVTAGLGELVAQVVALPLMVLLSFFMNKNFVFKRS